MYSLQRQMFHLAETSIWRGYMVSTGRSPIIMGIEREAMAVERSAPYSLKGLIMP